MPGRFYVHRLGKIIDELVLDAGLTVVLTDANSDVNLDEHRANIEQLAQSRNILAEFGSEGEQTIVRFRKA
ncbi:MAG: hypothetical protein AAFR04_13810 [Pseudomonadota bacterium]